MAELVSVAPDGAELFDDDAVHRVTGLVPDTDYVIRGVDLRTLPDIGRVTASFATGNDVHFGETACGRIDGRPGTEVYSVEDGDEPYPEVMSRSVVADIVAISPDTVVVKGDLTDGGGDEDYARFLDVWGGAFGARLVHVRGNHDGFTGRPIAAWPMQSRELDGVTLAVLDTAREREVGGFLSGEQEEWLDALADAATQPIVVLGHHPVWSPAVRQRAEGYLWMAAEDSARLIAVVSRRPALVAYLSGHTHRNARREFGGVPFVEVACVKDFPGGWAEYRVGERGIAQVFHRASSHDAIKWAERTRGMYGGFYGPWAMGSLEDRSFVIPYRD